MGLSDAEMIYEAISDDSSNRVTYRDGTVYTIKGNTAYVDIDGGARETPCRIGTSVKVGDRVQVVITGHSALLSTNYTDPSASEEDTKEARELADIAYKNVAKTYASVEAAAEAAQAAGIAANKAENKAARAEDAAERASAAAETAEELAQDALDAADEISELLSEVSDNADRAEQYAKDAGYSASQALGRLSDVEDVVGALDWIQKHATYVSAAGTDFDPNKAYWAYDSTLDYYYRVSNPTADDLSSYYTVDVTESVYEYVATHVSINNNGLWLTGYDDRYAVLVSSGTGSYSAGMHVVSGGRIVASYGETTVIGDLSKAHIEISDTNVSFKTADGTVVAYIDVDEDSGESMFYMTKAVVVKDLRFGNWKWGDRSNGNMALKWIGGVV